MLHAAYPPGFFDFADTGLDAKACALILKKLDDDHCARFLGMPIVGLEFSETTAAHEIRTWQSVDTLIGESISDPARRRTMSMDAKAMITLHDVSDIIKEVIIATTETDPVLKKQCAAQLLAYDQAATPFVYRLARVAGTMGLEESLFNGTIDTLRAQMVTPEQRHRVFTLDEAIDFCGRATDVIARRDASFSAFPQWHSPALDRDVARMMTSYNRIETGADYLGLLSQIMEKCDGMSYACSISEHKIAQNLYPTHYHFQGITIDRLNGRYEKSLPKLFAMADGDPELQSLAAATAMHCYEVSRAAYSFAKPYVSLAVVPGEPGLDDPHELHEKFCAQQKEMFEKNQLPATLRPRAMLVDTYANAIADFQQHGVLWLPQPGQTLVDAPPDRKCLGQERRRAYRA